MFEKGKYVKFRNNKRTIKPPFIIYADFGSILVPEDNEKQNPEESYTNKYHKHIASSHGYKLVCVDDKFSKPFKTYLCKDAIYNFINWGLKKKMKILRTLLNVGSVTIIMLTMVLKFSVSYFTI